jgi:MYXO-CTERM domain-containing protein
MKHVPALVVALSLTLVTASASAFCGFYVSGADADLYNNATMVSLMREGKRTVLSMQNSYEGPPEDFAMVVPVPVVLKKKDVKTLPDGVFDRLDAVTAPRLVEYWERDPCSGPRYVEDEEGGEEMAMEGPPAAPRGGSGGKVTVEAQFKVGEYDIVVLSSTESTALEDWLNQNDYNIPDGAAPYFKPYVQKGQYFFVAKINMDKVEYSDGEAVLSPIRFHYDSEDFVLPVRLGLINSKGAQDLIAFILARNQRYEVANFPNVNIPTNIPVKSETKENFAAFYRDLFNNVLQEHPQAVVTEYSWNAATCDPCPEPPIKPDELLTLGGDALPSMQPDNTENQKPQRARPKYIGRDWVITRLHTRYGKETLGEDLVFEAAQGIRGGRGMPRGGMGTLDEQKAVSSSYNQFQGRYIIRHFWEGEVDCEDPQYGRWGGPLEGNQPDPTAAGDLAFSEGENDRTFASFVQSQSKIPGLKMPVTEYRAPAVNVVKSWGNLLEESARPEATGVLDNASSFEEADWDKERPEPAGSAFGCRSGAGCSNSKDCSGGGPASAGFVLLALAGLSAARRQRR